jgi:heat shock protein HslJ
MAIGGLWLGVLALLLLPGPAAAVQTLSGPPAGVWTLVDFPGVGAVSEPRYTIQFQSNGRVDILADCNRAGGSWSGGDGVLSMAVTTSTMAFCPPDSISQPYLVALDGVSGYTVLDATLVLHGAAGTMTFAQ